MTAYHKILNKTKQMDWWWLGFYGILSMQIERLIMPHACIV